ncbi:hemogen [Turdus rufiventris]|nr:hemogen [Turdus rufiventris]
MPGREVLLLLLLLPAIVTLVAARGAELNEGSGLRRPVCEDLGDVQACPLLYLPICGTDGNTYANECQLCVEKKDNKKEQRSRARRAKRGRGRQTVVKAVLESEPAVDPQPDPEEKAEPVPSEPALPEPVHQQQPPLLTVENTVGGMQAVAVEGELADGSLDPAGEEDALKPAEADVLEELNTPLANDHQDNEYIPRILY